MEITLDKKIATHGVLKLQVVESDFANEVNEQAKKLSHQVQIKGFRPGKVPVGLIKKKYGEELRMEAINKTITSSVDNYLKEQGLEILFSPLLKSEPFTQDQVTPDKAMDVEFDIFLKPEVSYTLDESISIKKYDLEISDADVEETIVKLKESQKRPGVVDSVEEGDFIKAIFTTEDGSISEKESLLPLNKVPEELQKDFIGKKAEDVLTLDVKALIPELRTFKYLFDIEEAEAEKISGNITIKIEEVTRDKEAELDKEFFDATIGPDKANTEEEFRAELTQLLKVNNEPSVDFLYKDAIKKHFIDAVSVEFSDDLLKTFYERNAAEGQDLSEEKVATELPTFKSEILWQVISNNIFTDAGLEITDFDFKTAAIDQVSQQMMQYGINLPEDRMDEFADSYLQNAKQEEIERLTHTAHSKKVMEYILSKITLVEEKISLEGLNDKVKEATSK